MSQSEIEFSTQLLRTLHRIHRQRADLQSQIDRCPRQIKAGEAMVAKAEANLLEVKKKNKKATLVYDEKQLQLKTREMRIDELAAKLNTAGTNREFSALKEQIAADKQANSVQSDEIFEALEELDQIGEEIKAAQEKLDTQVSEHEVRVKEVEEKSATLTGELERVNGELESVEKSIPSAARADYDRLIKAKGEEALAPVDAESSCGGCYTTLTTQQIDRLRMSALIRCANCNAFLYIPEDRSP